MRVTIEGSPEEVESKRAEIIKAIAKDKLDVVVKPKGQKTFGTVRPPFYNAQKEILSHWDERFKKMLGEIKEEVSKVLEG